MAAERSWKYLEAHPDIVRNDREPDEANGSVDYVLRITPRDDIPFRVWAAAELYLSTGNDKYHQYFLKHYKEVPIETSGWHNPALAGFTDYLTMKPDDKTIQKDPSAVIYLKGNILRLANRYITGMKTFPHESNYLLLERTGVLLTAYDLTQDVKYRTAATRAVDYLFGVNPLGQSYLTGIGAKSVQRPDDRMMKAAGKLIEGYVVSGPDTNATDGRTPKGLGAASYRDDEKASSVNTPNILYNASLAYVLGALNASYNITQAPNQPPKTLDEKIHERNRKDSGH